jgi:hypothetical protein
VSISYSVEIRSEDALRELQRRAERIGGGMGPDWAGPALSTELAVISRERFERQPWPPLAPSTVRARANRWGHYRMAPASGSGPTGPVLQWTGRLKESLADPRGRGSTDAVVIMTNTRLVQGTRVPYAAAHHESSSPFRPRRKLFDLSRDELERLTGIWEEFILED